MAQVAGYALEAPAPPFPVFVMGYAINGFGMSLQDAGANGFVVSLKDNATTKMGILITTSKAKAHVGTATMQDSANTVIIGTESGATCFRTWRSPGGKADGILG